MDEPINSDSDISEDNFDTNVLVSIDKDLNHDDFKSNPQMTSNSHFGVSVDDFIKSRKSRSSRRKTNRVYGHKLPVHLQDIYDEAQKCFIKQQYPEAKHLLSNLVKEIPEYAGIYSTLGLIYESEKQMKNALECFYLAANLTKTDISLWVQVADLCQTYGMKERELECYKRILRINKTDATILKRRALLYEEKGNDQKAYNDYITIISLLPDDYSSLLSLYQLSKKLFYISSIIPLFEVRINSILLQIKNINESLQLSNEVELAIRNNQLSLLLKNVHALADCYSKQGQYEKCVQLIERCSQVLSIPLPLDMAISYGVSKIHLNDEKSAMNCFNLVLDQDTAEYKDLLYEIAEAMAETSHYDKCITIINRLIKIQEYQIPSVYSLMAQCYTHLNEKEKAIDIYKVILSFPPTQLSSEQKFHVALSLADLYEEKKDQLSAAEVLNQYTNGSRRRQLLTSTHSMTPLEKQVQQQQFQKIRTFLDEALSYYNEDNITSKVHYLDICDSLLKAILQEPLVSLPYSSSNMNTSSMIYNTCLLIDVPSFISQLELFTLIIQVAKIHYELGQPQLSINLISSIVDNFRFTNLHLNRSLYIYSCFYSCVLGNYSAALISLRTVLSHILVTSSQKTISNKESINNKDIDLTQNTNKSSNSSSLSVETICSYISILMHFISYQDMILLHRQVSRSEVNDYKTYIVSLLNAQIYLYRKSSTCRVICLNPIQYLPDDPIIPFLAAISYMNIILSRKNMDSLGTCLSSFALFTEYAKKRQNAAKKYLVSIKDLANHINDKVEDIKTNSNDINLENTSTSQTYIPLIQMNLTEKYTLPLELWKMEILYNMGRAYHQIGEFYIAIQYYHKVLSIEDECQPIPIHYSYIWSSYSVAFNAAYNLKVIYENSGNRELARTITLKYLSI